MKGQLKEMVQMFRGGGMPKGAAAIAGLADMRLRARRPPCDERGGYVDHRCAASNITERLLIAPEKKLV